MYKHIISYSLTHSPTHLLTYSPHAHAHTPSVCTFPPYLTRYTTTTGGAELTGEGGRGGGREGCPEAGITLAK